MKVIEMTPISMGELRELANNLEEKQRLSNYIKKFGKLNKDKSLKLAQDIEALNNLKIKKEHIVKIADFLPKDAEDLGKIFNDISLDEKETNEILEIVSKY